MRIVTSKNSLRIRLTDERWTHIINEHAELTDMQIEVLNAIAEPQRILEGGAGEFLAVHEVEVGKWLVVVYREMEDDGFVITAFLTRRGRALEKRRVVWSQ